MNKYTNLSNCSPLLAPWLVYDSYDHNPDPYTISVSTLIKSTKSIILGARASKFSSEQPLDIFSRLKSRVGTAVHDSVEHLWKNQAQLEAALKELGQPDRIIKAYVINPDPSKVTDDHIPIYLEQRVNKKVGKWTVSGKYDCIFDGSVRDIKNTSTYTYEKGTNDKDYILQGSYYRWLNPTLVTSDTMYIDYIFSDWKDGQSNSPNYPSAPHVPKPFKLDPITLVQSRVESKLNDIERFWDSAEDDMPACTSDELWQDQSTWKYYANGFAGAVKATKVFEHPSDAFAHRINKGKGEVVEVKSKPKKCRFCPALSICKQAKALGVS